MWFLRVVLGLAFLTGLFPVSHILFMQTERMQMSSETSTLDGAMTAGRDIAAPCCNDALGSPHPTCAFIVPQFACAAYHAGTDRIAFSTFSIQNSSRDTTTPPPKT